MPFLVLLLVAIIVAALVARRRALSRNCRWRADATGNRGNLRKYNCVACGAEAFTASKGPPQDCKANAKGRAL